VPLFAQFLDDLLPHIGRHRLAEFLTGEQGLLSRGRRPLEEFLTRRALVERDRAAPT